MAPHLRENSVRRSILMRKDMARTVTIADLPQPLVGHTCVGYG